ncbi:cofactor assembly of complex C [Perilla frutescens var. hirtella]|uniref:Cofactor assembly of complex C n=1 Tax=Perilla frutescens var. hirtella TaxID=608512 RepID=A0AAD4IP13_PERFH|nr:cofactor assembly of complex C [Perilla frutescens var. hirtella]
MGITIIIHPKEIPLPHEFILNRDLLAQLYPSFAEGATPFFTLNWSKYAEFLTFRGGLDQVTRGLWLTDIAHHNLAIDVLFLIAGHMYRTNWGIGHGLKDILEAHKGPFTSQGHKGLYEILTTSWHAQLYPNGFLCASSIVDEMIQNFNKGKNNTDRFSMEAGILQRLVVPLNPPRRRSVSRLRSIRVSLNSEGESQVPKPKRELLAEWVSKNDDVVRSLPIYIGGASLVAVLLNRAVSGIAPVADASSSQSRADLLTLGLAVTNILNGLVWLSIRPKTIYMVDPNGVECRRINHALPEPVISELLWAWESLSDVTCCRSLVVVYDGICMLQIGFADVLQSNGDEPVVVDADKLIQGSLYKGAFRSGSQSYLANLSLYPGKTELPFLPSNTQAVILQPLGNKGIAIVGGDTIRGFTTSDQAWITLIGEKLDATLAKAVDKAPLTVQEKS